MRTLDAHVRPQTREEALRGLLNLETAPVEAGAGYVVVFKALGSEIRVPASFVRVESEQGRSGCPKCGSDDVQHRGMARGKGRVHCTDCGKWSYS